MDDTEERYRLIVTLTDYGLEKAMKAWEEWKSYAKPTQKGYNDPPTRVFEHTKHNSLSAAKAKITRMQAWENPERPKYESIKIQRGVVQWREMV